MIEHKQLYFHRPNENLIGDCWRTCIACVVGASAPDDIPHYYEILWDKGANVTPGVHAKTNELLAQQFGARYVEYPLAATFEELKTYLTHYYRDRYVIVGCNSKHGGHSVIMKNADYMWDPSKDNSGCAGPMEDGYYWIGLLIVN